MNKPKWDNNNDGGNTFDYKTLPPVKNKGLLAWEVRRFLNEAFFKAVYETLNKEFRHDKKEGVPTLYEFAWYILKEIGSFEIAKKKYTIRNLIDARLPNISPTAFGEYNNLIFKNLTKEERDSIVNAYDSAPDLKTNQGLEMIIPINNTSVALQMLFSFFFYKINAVGWAISTQKKNPDTKKKCFDFGMTKNSKALNSLVSHLNSIIKNEAITKQIEIDSVFGYWIKVFDNPRVFDIRGSYQKQNENNLIKNPQAQLLVPSEYDLNKYAKYDVYGPGKDRLDFLIADFVNDRPITNSYAKQFNQSAQELLLELAKPHNKYQAKSFPTKETQKTLNRVIPQYQNQQTQNTQTIDASQFVVHQQPQTTPINQNQFQPQQQVVQQQPQTTPINQNQFQPQQQQVVQQQPQPQSPATPQTIQNPNQPQQQNQPTKPQKPILPDFSD